MEALIVVAITQFLWNFGKDVSGVALSSLSTRKEKGKREKCCLVLQVMGWATAPTTWSYYPMVFARLPSIMNQSSTNR
jgi:hypothetical protein